MGRAAVSGRPTVRDHCAGNDVGAKSWWLFGCGIGEKDRDGCLSQSVVEAQAMEEAERFALENTIRMHYTDTNGLHLAA